MRLSDLLQNISIKSRLILLLCTSTMAISVSSGYIAYEAFKHKQNLEKQAEGHNQSSRLSDYFDGISSQKALFKNESTSSYNIDQLSQILNNLKERQESYPFIEAELQKLNEMSKSATTEDQNNSTSQRLTKYTTLAESTKDTIKMTKKVSTLKYNKNSHLSDIIEIETVTLPNFLDEISKIFFQINNMSDDKIEASSKYIESNLDSAVELLSIVETWVNDNPRLYSLKFKELNSEFENFSDSTYDFIFDSERTQNTEEQYLALLTKYKEFRTLYNTEIIKTMSKEFDDVSYGLWLTISLMILIITALVTISSFVNSSIIKPLSEFKNLVVKITNDCDFSVRSNEKGNNEIGEMSNSFNELISLLDTSFKEVNIVINATAMGELDKTIKVKGTGDVDKLINGVNSSVANIKRAFEGVDIQMQQLKEGNFKAEVTTELPGEFGKIVGIVADSKKALSKTITDISNTLSALANGQLTERVTSIAKGDLLTLKENVNESIDRVATAVETIQETATHLENGNLTHRITTKQEGQFEQICQALNSSMNSMQNTMGGVIKAATELSDEANQVFENSREISRHIQSQAASIEETSASMEELNMTVRNNADSSNVAKQLSADARDETATSISIMKETTKAMKGIEVMSIKVHEIIQVIDDIAFQTNLLALNAKVEAARAGINGKGFAVVAGEVGNLAQKSADAAKEIKDLVEASVEQTKEGSELVIETSNALNKIDGKMKEAADVFNEISAATNEQAQGIEQVSIAVLSMDKSTQENSIRVEESATTAESMASKAEGLKESMGTFKTE